MHYHTAFPGGGQLFVGKLFSSLGPHLLDGKSVLCILSNDIQLTEKANK